MKKLLILLIHALPFIITTCKDDKPEFFVDQDTRDYCVFKEGSWWLYEEEATSEKDCVWVTQSKEKKLDSDNLNNIRNGYDMILFSTLWKKQNVQITCWAGGGSGDPEINRFQELITFPLALEDYTFLSTSDPSAKISPHFGYEFGLIESKDTFIVEGKDYYNVRIFEANIGLHQFWQRKIFRAKHIGKIRYEKGDGTIWNLVNYNIIQ